MLGKQIKEHLAQLSNQGMKASDPLVEQYNEIILTAEQEAEALRIGRETEFFKRQREEYKMKLQASLQYPKFNQEQLWGFYGMQYKIDKDNENVVQQLCYYFSGDTRFKGDLNKGILLAGGVGVGKTSLMQFFSRNQVYSYRIISCRSVENDFDKNGYDAIETYSNNLPIAVNANPFGHQIVGYCFDDIGTESDGKHFGKQKNMMTEIILNRYDRKVPFHSTHITTNLKASELMEGYGTRATDRLKEMVNIITFPNEAKSRRQ